MNQKKNKKLNKAKTENNVSFDENKRLSYHQKKLKALKTRREIRRIQISLVRFRWFARIIGILVIAFGLYQFAYLPMWYLNPEIFKYYPSRSLMIQGNQIVSQFHIMTRLKELKLPNRPLYLTDVSPIQQEIMKLAPIKKVYVRRFWFPARLKIVVEEKKPILSISPNPKAHPIAVFADDGTVIGKSFLPLNYTGRTYLVITHDNYNNWSIKHIKYIEILSDLIERASGKKLLYLDIRNPDDVFAQVENTKFRLGELNRTVFTRAKRIGPVLGEALKINNDIDYIDLRWESSVSIKLKDKAPKIQKNKLNKDIIHNVQ